MTGSSPTKVAVIGAGVAGSVCARQLARAGHSVLLLERDAHPAPRFGETCGPGLMRELRDRAGLTIPVNCFTPLDLFHSAWGSSLLDARNHRHWAIGTGAILDRLRFDEWLRSEAVEAGVTLRRDATLIKGDWIGGRWVLFGQGADGQFTNESAFVVEASGRASAARCNPAAVRQQIDRLVAITQEVDGTHSETVKALVESSEDGWWYGAEVADSRRVVTFFTDADLLKDARSLRERFTRMVHLRDFAPALECEKGCRVTSAATGIRRCLWQGTWVAIGDAAFSIDPLSGSGIERAVRDGLGTAEDIDHFLRTGSSSALKARAVQRALSFKQALDARLHAYRAEGRWPASVFWQRRHDDTLVDYTPQRAAEMSVLN